MASKTRAKSALSDTWLLEIFSCLFSVLSMLVIVLLLQKYDLKPIFTWRGLSLNSFVSIFATLSKALLLLTVSSCLGQWKFISFAQGRRKLIDFDTYDSASRGPKGSVVLLWQTRLGSLSAIGAVITIICLAFDPFVQQVIGLRELQVSTQNSSTTIPRALRYSQGAQTLVEDSFHDINGFSYDTIIPSCNFSMQAAILSGLSSDLATITQQIPVRCPSGNCRFETYESLSVCSSCSDITQSLTSSTKDYTVSLPYEGQIFDFLQNNPGLSAAIGLISTLTLPNGLHVDPGNGPAAVFYGTSNKTNTITFTDNNALMWAMTILRNISLSQGYTATECGLFYCVRDYSSSVINGTLSESSSMATIQQSPNSRQPVNASIPVPCPDQLDVSVDYPRADLQFGNNFKISQVAINGIGFQMRSVFNMPDTLIRDNTSTFLGPQIIDNATGWYVKQTEDLSDQFNPAAMQPLFESTNLSATFDVLAHSMSNNMRLNDDNGTTITGTNGITVYKIRWAWICLPFLAVIGSCIFLMLTIYQQRSRNLAIWKSSSLAALRCGASMGALLDGEHHAGWMEDKAKTTYISLFDTETGKPTGRPWEHTDSIEMHGYKALNGDTIREIR